MIVVRGFHFRRRLGDGRRDLRLLRGWGVALRQFVDGRKSAGPDGDAAVHVNNITWFLLERLCAQGATSYVGTWR